MFSYPHFLRTLLLSNKHSLFTFILFTLLLNSFVFRDLSYANANDSARQKAFLLQSQGRERFEAGQYEEAIRLWREAYLTYQDNKLLLFIASTYAKIPDACQAEDQSWSAYLNACKESVCPNKDRGMLRYKGFKKRCYAKITVDTSTPNASLSYQGQEWGTLPHQREVLLAHYQRVKVSAPGYLSKWIEIDVSNSQRAQAFKPLNVSLTKIPQETFFEQHQLKLALSTTVIGVSLLGMGSLQASSASTLAAEVEAREYPNEFKNPAERQSYLTEYQADQDSYKSKQLWGSVMVTAGLASLGAGLWMLFYEGPNAAVLEQARRQGDLAHHDLDLKADTPLSAWSFNPLSSPASLFDGIEAKWTLKF